MSRILGKVLLSCLAATALFTARPPAALSQAQSVSTAPAGFRSVTGTVMDERSNPIARALVTVVGTDLKALTNERGAFQIDGLDRAANATLRITIIGWQPVNQSITPADTRIQVVMTPAAVNLDAIVVTGTAIGTQTRAIGNVVEKVNAAEILANTAVIKAEQVIAARTPGVMVLPPSGQVGTGAPIRIRGQSSMSLNNDPIVFIDGVRMDSDPRQGPGGRISRLNDINPEDISSIEIIKGPTAAT
jgi:hypothetical protein